MLCMNHRRRCGPILIGLGLVLLGLEPAVTAQTPPGTSPQGTGSSGSNPAVTHE